MKFIFSNAILNRDSTSDFSRAFLFQEIGSFQLLLNDETTIVESPRLFSCTDGYLKDFSLDSSQPLKQKLSAAENVLKHWPVDQNISGSFSSLILNKANSELILCTDSIGIYPLYYLINEGKMFVSNSMILLGRCSNSPFDDAGIFQRAVGPEFSNMGSRTILKNCKRLLPGEYLKFDGKTVELIEKKYDNQLFQNIGSNQLQKEDTEKYWFKYKEEVANCLESSKNVNVALSGGIDSRIVLGAIPQDSNINTYTFGDANNYETIVAKKLSGIKNARHQIFPQSDLFFPNLEILKKYTLNTEAIKICSWLEILENVEKAKKEPLLIGELCEALPARNLKKFSSTGFRQSNFFKYYLKRDDFVFEESTPDKFTKWKENVSQDYFRWHDDNWFNKLKLTDQKSEIIQALQHDLEEIFSRIEAHNLPFTELYDELFSWYTYTRTRLSHQVGICNEKFYAYSPAMSLQMLKRTSNIHPNLRLYYRFANLLFKSNKDLAALSKVPTSQIPLIPQNYPDFIKMPLWGLRSKIDKWLINRMMKLGNPQKRYRLFKSVDWMRIYQEPSMEQNIQDYFKNNQLTKDYYTTFYQLAKKRKNLTSWPFANIDIMSASALNVELDLIINGTKNKV